MDEKLNAPAREAILNRLDEFVDRYLSDPSAADAERIEAGDIRKAQFKTAAKVDPVDVLAGKVLGFECDRCHKFNEVDGVNDGLLLALQERFGTIPPETAPDAPDGPEIPSRSAISDEDRASIRKIGEKLFGWTAPTVFEHMVAEGVRERDSILELTADRDNERHRAESLAILLERAQERYDESRELLAQAGIKLVERDRDIAELELDVADRDEAMGLLRAQVARLEHDIASREQATLRRDERIAELFGLVEARDRLLDRILDLVIDAKGGEAKPQDALDDQEWSDPQADTKGGK